jgi:hypothetical protein
MTSGVNGGVDLELLRAVECCDMATLAARSLNSATSALLLKALDRLGTGLSAISPSKAMRRSAAAPRRCRIADPA